MSKLYILLALVALTVSGRADGQRSVEWFDGSVYALQQFNTDYMNATDQCFEFHRGDMAGKDQTTLALLSKTSEDAAWIYDNLDQADDSNENLGSTCTALILQSGDVERKACSTKLPFVCKTDETWTDFPSFKDHNYTFSSTKLRYTDARQICQKQAESRGVSGGSLVTILTEEEQDFIELEIQSLRDETGEEAEYFINNDKEIGGTGFTNWDDGQPTMDSSQCVLMTTEPNLGKWKEDSCYEYKQFICKWPMYEKATTAEPGITKQGMPTTENVTITPAKHLTMASMEHSVVEITGGDMASVAPTLSTTENFTETVTNSAAKIPLSSIQQFIQAIFYFAFLKLFQ